MENEKRIVFSSKDSIRNILQEAISVAIKESIKDNSIFILKAIKLLMKLN